MRRRQVDEAPVAAAATAWQSFVIEHGWRVPAHHLSAVLGVSEEDVARVRASARCVRRREALQFPELFRLWKGREPRDDEWFVPKVIGGNYEWLATEEVFMAGLVGQVGSAAIVEAVNARLRLATGDQAAARSHASVTQRINRLGLQLDADVLGGVTVAVAGAQVGSRHIVQEAIASGELRTRKVGRVHVIPYKQWKNWSARRTAAPAGKVKLSSIRGQLGISSDSKLPEFAKLGYIETAELHLPDGANERGVWYVSAAVAEKLVTDRREGRPMPWHGKPLASNLVQTYRLWAERRHPASCDTCRIIWGGAAAPEDFDAYMRRYPQLAFGAKRHLTMPWNPGLTAAGVAKRAMQSVERVDRALDSGSLAYSTVDGVRRVTETAAALWIQRKCPDGSSQRSWLAIETAERQYGFSRAELMKLIGQGRLNSKVGTDGAMRGITYVLKSQCAEIRHRDGFTLAEAARRAGVTVARFRELLLGVNWRGAKGGAHAATLSGEDAVPLATLQAVIKRLQSAEGWTIDEVAINLGIARSEIQQLVDAGTLRLARNRWSPDRPYLTERMVERLRSVRFLGQQPVLGADWLLLSDAAKLAGVSASTVMRWAEEGDLTQRPSSRGWRYSEASVKARARSYWPTVRNHRSTPPTWLQKEDRDHEVAEASKRVRA